MTADRVRAQGDRGATLVEYALLVALLLVVRLGAIQSIEQRGSSKVDTGAVDRGTPTEQLNIPSGIGTIIGGGSGSTVGSGAATVSVFDVASSSARTGGDWVATVTVKVQNASTSELWAGVTVTGVWHNSDGTISTGSCTTTDEGLCPITSPNLKWAKIDWTVFDTIVLSGPAGSGIVHQAPSPDPVSTSGTINKAP